MALQFTLPAPTKVRRKLPPLRLSIVTTIALLASSPAAAAAETLNPPRPIEARQSLCLEELTWMETRDLVKQGTTRIIIPTGGIEQNGPFVALNKHDLIVQAVALKTATLLGNTLVAPTVSFVPEGNHSPPSGHMTYPGTISLTEDTFVRLLCEIGSSMISHGFEEIVFLGDSGDSQQGMKRAADVLTAQRGKEARIRYIPEFYDYESLRELLKARGFPLTPEKFHEELPFTLQLLAIAPQSARYDERRKAGLLTLNGTSLADLESLAALGREIIQIRALKTAGAIEPGASPLSTKPTLNATRPE